MTSELVIVAGLLAAAIVMFAVNRPRMDVVALLMIVLLALSGVITPEEALAGFSDPNIVMIAALFVVGEALVRTGVAQSLGDWLARRAGASEARLIVLLMIVVAGIGSIMSSTGVVAIFIPVVLRIGQNADIPAGRLMMPLSVAALISGMMTLVATPPNLVVNAELVRRGVEGFHFFAFAPFGVPILVLAIAYMLLVRRFLGGNGERVHKRARPGLLGWIEEYDLGAREHRLRVPAGAPVAGRRLAELDLRGSAGVNILAIERRGRFARELIQPRAETELRAGDALLIDLSSPDLDIAAIRDRYGLEALPLSGAYFTDRSQEIGMAEAMITPTSSMIGATLAEARFRNVHDLAVVGIKRGRKPLGGVLAAHALELGDTLLMVGPWRAIRRLEDRAEDLILLDLPREMDAVAPAASRAPQAVVVVLLTVAMMVTGVVPNVIAVLIGCLLLGLFGCIDMTAAYRSIHFKTLVLIVGMLPFSLALQRTGGVDLAAGALFAALGDAGPHLVLAAIFAVTALLGMFISNTATAVLMAPVALAVAGEMGASPYPFAMTVALAASAAFMTPVSSPVNTLVVGPGNYRFVDFVRIGMPFALVTLLATVVLVPLVLPF